MHVHTHNTCIFILKMDYGIAYNEQNDISKTSPKWLTLSFFNPFPLSLSMEICAANIFFFFKCLLDNW